MKSNGNGHWNCGPLTEARKQNVTRFEHLSRVVRIARVLRRTVKANIVWAFSYNGVAVALASGGLMQPILVAPLMAGSSFIVIANALRISKAFDAASR